MIGIKLHVLDGLKRIFTSSSSVPGDGGPAARELPDGGIIEFYGVYCGYCTMLEPAVDRLEREDGVKVTRLETWIDRRNKALMESLSDLFEEFNDGNYTVPTFYDPTRPRHEQILVNPMTYEELRAWAVDARQERPPAAEGRVKRGRVTG